MANIRHGSINEEKLSLIIKKGFFPFKLATSVARMKNIIEFPPESAFENDLNEPIEKSNYLHAKKTWEVFKTKSLFEYSQLYCLGIIINAISNVEGRVGFEFELNI